MTKISYYQRAQAGEPVIGELLEIWPELIADSIAQNAALATKKFFARRDFPIKIKHDTFTTTLKRKYCKINDIHLYETYYDNPLFAEVSFLSSGCIADESIALAVGTRSRNSAIDRISDYPYLAESIERLKLEFSLSRVVFQSVDG